MQPIPSMRELRTALAIAALSLPATAQLDLLADLAPGRAGSNPRDFIEVGGRTLFVTAESGGVARLWTTDGTANGTSEVALLGSGLSPRAFAIAPGGGWGWSGGGAGRSAVVSGDSGMTTPP